MAKRNYKIDRAQPSKADMQEFKNLDQVLSGAQGAGTAGASGWSAWKLLIAGGIGAAALTGVFLMNSEETVQPEEVALIGAPIDTVVSLQLDLPVNPPIAEHDVQFESYQVSGSDVQEIITRSGNKLVIDPNSFDISTGEDFAIKYREFYHPLDVFLSGITMKYDSAGNKYDFQTGGMFEIRAEKDGEPVALKSGQTIPVEFFSLEASGRFSNYSLNDETGTWTNELNQKVKPCSPQTYTPEALVEESASNVLEPTLAGEETYIVEVEYDPAQFEALSEYEHVVFQVGEGEDFSPDDYLVRWDSIWLTFDAGRYQVHMAKDELVKELQVQPVFQQDHYAQAKAQFEAQQARRAAKKEMLAMRKEEQEAAEAVAQAEVEMVNRFRGVVNRMPQSIRYLRVGLGIHNIDEIIPNVYYDTNDRMVAYMRPRLLDAATGEPISHGKFYVVRNGLRTVFSYESAGALMYDTVGKNHIWTLTSVGEMVILPVKGYGGQADPVFKVKPLAVDQGLRKLAKAMNG